MAEPFGGFPSDTFTFFRELARNNNREWFLRHKDMYERSCRAPLQALVAELEPHYGRTRISRINRDMRFARDRMPYKTYIAAGVGGRYLSLSAEGLWVGAGLYRPAPMILQRFRAAIDDDATGRELDAIVTALRRRGYEVASHETLSSVPRGYAADHPRLELLRMKDIFAGRLFPPSSWRSTGRARDPVDRVMAETGALVSWLQKHVSGRRDEWHADRGGLQARGRQGATIRSDGK